MLVEINNHIQEIKNDNTDFKRRIGSLEKKMDKSTNDDISVISVNSRTTFDEKIKIDDEKEEYKGGSSSPVSSSINNSFIKTLMNPDGNCGIHAIRKAVVDQHGKEKLKEIGADPEEIRRLLYKSARSDKDLLYKVYEDKKKFIDDPNENYGKAYKRVLMGKRTKGYYLTELEIEILAKALALNIIIINDVKTKSGELLQPVMTMFYGDETNKKITFISFISKIEHFDVLHLFKGSRFIESDIHFLNFQVEESVVKGRREKDTDYNIDDYARDNKDMKVDIMKGEDFSFNDIHKIDEDINEKNPIKQNDEGKLFSLHSKRKQTVESNDDKWMDRSTFYIDNFDMGNVMKVNHRRSSGVHPLMSPEESDSVKIEPKRNINSKIKEKKSHDSDPDDSSSDSSTSDSSLTSVSDDDSDSGSNNKKKKKSKKKKNKMKEKVKQLAKRIKQVTQEKKLDDIVIRQPLNLKEAGLTLDINNGQVLLLVMVSSFLDKVTNFRSNPVNRGFEFTIASCLNDNAKTALINANSERWARNWSYKTEIPRIPADMNLIDDKEITKSLLYASTPSDLAEAIRILRSIKLSPNAEEEKQIIETTYNAFNFTKYLSAVTQYMNRFVSVHSKMKKYGKNPRALPQNFRNKTPGGHNQILGAINIIMEKVDKINPLMTTVFNNLDQKIANNIKANFTVEQFVAFMRGYFVDISAHFNSMRFILDGLRKPEDTRNIQKVQVLQRSRDVNSFDNAIDYDGESMEDDQEFEREYANLMAYTEQKKLMIPKSSAKGPKKDPKELPCFLMGRCPDAKNCVYSHDLKVYQKFIDELSNYINTLGKDVTNKTNLVEHAFKQIKEMGYTNIDEIDDDVLNKIVDVAQRLSPAHVKTTVHFNDDVEEIDSSGRQL